MTQKTERLLAFNTKSMTKQQICAMIARIDAATIAMKTQMQNMGTQYKLKVGIPALRDFDAAKKRLNSELNNRK